MNRIVILKRTAFGDIIHTLPVITALRRAYPLVHITWIVEHGFAPLVSAVEGVDQVVELGFRSMMRRGALRLYRERLRALGEHRADALIDFQGTLKSWLLLTTTNTERRIGFNRADAREPLVTRLYTEQVPPMPYGLHIVRQNLRLLRPLGIGKEEIIYPRLHLDLADEEFVDAWFDERVRGEVIAINPFTTWTTKNWPPEHAAALCAAMPRETGMKPLLLWGPGEREAAEAIVRQSGGAAMLAPRTTLTQLVALLRRCALYLGGDTGPTHLAAALGTPVVALFGPTDPRRNGPIAADDETLWLQMECRGCTRHRCRLNPDGPECLLKITPEVVMSAIRNRLARLA